MDGTTQLMRRGAKRSPLSQEPDPIYYPMDNICPALASRIQGYAFRRRVSQLVDCTTPDQDEIPRNASGSKLPSRVRPFSHAAPTATRDCVPYNVKEPASRSSRSNVRHRSSLP